MEHDDRNRSESEDKRVHAREIEKLLAEVAAVSDQRSDRLEHTAALYLELDWLPFLRRLARVPLRKRRALLCVALNKVGRPLYRFMDVAQILSAPAKENEDTPEPP